MDSASTLREQMVDALHRNGSVTTASVEAAMRAVPRHVFLPESSLQEAYLDQPVVTKRDPSGAPISSASQPAIVAIMLEQLDVREGHHVLEIGAGTGYNAALLDYLVGSHGSVTTVDIDEDIVEGARSALAEAGAADVTVVCDDGGLGYPAGAPYDRIIVTVGAWDLPRAWFDQLRLDGLLVVPLGVRGAQRSVVFEREVDRWHGLSAVDCGFMPMRGDYADQAAPITVGGTIDIRPADTDPTSADSSSRTRSPTSTDTGIDGKDGGNTASGRLDNPAMTSPTRPSAGIDAEVLWEALHHGGTDTATGMSVTAAEVIGGADLWLAVREADYCRVLGHHDADELPALRVWDGTTSTSGLIRGGSCALLGGPDLGPLPLDGAEAELHVHAHGSEGALLADRLIQALRLWDAQHRPATDVLRIDAYPSSPKEREPVTALAPELIVVDKPEVRLTLAWVVER